MRKRFNVVLDLDHTLISSVRINQDTYPFKYTTMNNDFIVYHRPYLAKFLTYIFKTFNVGVWTAANKEYAVFIVDKIILRNHPERRLDFLLYDYHGNISDQLYNSPKNLKLLWNELELEDYSPDNTFIIDDYQEVYLPQLDNALPIKPFDVKNKNAEQDKVLLELIYKLKRLKRKKYPTKELITRRTAQMISRKLSS